MIFARVVKPTVILALLLSFTACSAAEPNHLYGLYSGDGLAPVLSAPSDRSQKVGFLRSGDVVAIDRADSDNESDYHKISFSSPWTVADNDDEPVGEGFVRKGELDLISTEQAVLNFLENHFNVEEDMMSGTTAYRHPYVEASELRAVPYIVRDNTTGEYELRLYLNHAGGLMSLALPSLDKWVVDADGERIELWEKGIGQAFQELGDELEMLGAIDPDLALLQRAARPVADFPLSAYWEWNKLAQISTSQEARYFVSINMAGIKDVADFVVPQEQKDAMLITLQAWSDVCGCNVDIGDADWKGMKSSVSNTTIEASTQISEANVTNERSVLPDPVPPSSSLGVVRNQIEPQSENQDKGWCCAQVVGVENWDVLNVRLSPEANAEKVGSLTFDARGISVFECRGQHDRNSLFSEAEAGSRVRGTWCLIGEHLDASEPKAIGWVNAHYLSVRSP